jgi:L-alanine-DL-glutamate epimerase-like enolase superfamily enzyme
MKIEAVDAFYFRMPEVYDIGDGSQDALLIRVSAGGHEGWGECEAAPLPTIAALVAPISHSACHPVLDSVLGQAISDPADIGRIHLLVKERSLDLLQTDHALSGIDIALWDLLGKAKGIPVWSFFSGANHPKTAYASQLFGETAEETYASARMAASKGFMAGKFGWGPIGRGTLAEDQLQLAAARNGLGHDRTLLVDTGCVFGHEIERAASRISLFEEFRVGWWEEPFATGALAEYSALAGLTAIPLAGGEGAHNADQARHLVDYARIGYLQVDAGRIGGITAARQAALHAHSSGVSFVNHTFTSNLALSASLQPYADFEGGYAEVPVAMSPLAVAIGGPLWSMKEGLVRAPEAPGLGVTPDLKRLAEYRVDVEIVVGGTRVWPTEIRQ